MLTGPYSALSQAGLADGGWHYSSFVIEGSRYLPFLPVLPVLSLCVSELVHPVQRSRKRAPDLRDR